MTAVVVDLAAVVEVEVAAGAEKTARVVEERGSVDRLIRKQ